MNIKLFTNIIKQFRDSKVKVSYVLFQKIYILVENGILVFLPKTPQIPEIEL